jgi:putative acetyltransferase
MIVVREDIASRRSIDPPSERGSVRAIHGGEHRRQSSLFCDRLLSLVAVLDKRIVGHILFSPVVLESEGREHNGMGLGPMAVLPSLQKQGIGFRLVEEGLARMRRAGCPFVVVLGHHEYYPRFGFERASKYGVRCQWDGVPDEVFMILVDEEGAIPAEGGVIRYREEFNEAI